MAAATAFKSPVPHPESAWSSPAPRQRARTLTYPLTPPTMASETVPPFASCVSGPTLHSTSDISEPEWYNQCIPVSSPYSQYGFEPAYTTPHSSVPSFSPMVDMAKSSEASYPAMTGYAPIPVTEASHTADVKGSPAFIDTKPSDSYVYGFVPTETLPNRPRSSPSTFSPTNPSSRPEEYAWTGNPLGITDPTLPDHHPMYGHPSLANRTPRMSEPTMGGAPDLASPQPRRSYQPIAPNPMGVQRINQLKRPRDDEESPDGKRRKRSTSSAFSMDLSEEDRLLIRLKDDENMPWKEIAAKFQSDLGKTYQIPALQMRLKRLRERLRVWTEADLRALRLAHEYWIQSKFEIIAAKMVEFGAQERWTSRQCARKWQEIDPGPTFPAATFEHAPGMHTPYTTFTTSPVEAAPGFLPYLQIPS